MIDLSDAIDTLSNFEESDPPEDRVRAAQALVQAAVDILAGVAEETGDANAAAYVVDHLRVIAGRGHGFLDGSMTLDDWVDRLAER